MKSDLRMIIVLFVCMFLSYVCWSQVNSSTSGAQQNASISMDQNGNYVVVWESLGTDGDDYGIYAQRFNYKGSADGSEVRVNTTTSGGQRHPDVAKTKDGNHVVVWSTIDNGSWDINGQRYRPSGATNGSEFLGNHGNNSGEQSQPAVACGHNNQFVIVWTNINTSGTYSIMGQRFDSTGSAVSSEFTINSSSADFHGHPHVAMNLNTGSFVVVWQSKGVDGSGNGIYGQRYNASGTKTGSEFRINTTTSGNQEQARIAMDGSGDFVVTWSSYGQDGSHYGIYAQRFASSGASQGSEFVVNKTTSGTQSSPSIAMTQEGSFAILWTGFNSNSQSQPYVNGYDSTGTLVLEEAVFTQASNMQLAPEIAAYSEEVNFAYTFHQGTRIGSNGDGDSYGIYGVHQYPGDVLFDALNLTQITPAQNGQGVLPNVNLVATFDQNLKPASVDSTTIRVWGEFSGLIEGSYSLNNNAVTFNPDGNFLKGEKITVSLTQQLESSGSRQLAKRQGHHYLVAAREMKTTPAAFMENVIDKKKDAQHIYPTDYDGDGDVDVLASTPTGSIYVYSNDGSGSFTSSLKRVSYSGNDFTQAIPADMNNDGNMDYVYVDQTAKIIQVHNENASSSSLEYVTVKTSSSAPTEIHCSDIDSDGDMDVVACYAGLNSVYWYENNGTGTGFTEHLVDSGANNPTGVYAEDVDTDGDMDILSSSYNDDKIIWYENSQFLEFTPHVITSVANGASDVHAVDLDSDGDMDVLSCSQEDNVVAWYENNGSESFTRTVISSGLNNPTRVYANDLNADGDMDILVASKGDNKITWFYNNGSESFTASTVTSSASGVASLHTADVDGDGFLDILSASPTDSTFAWYKPDVTFTWQGTSDTTWGTGNNWRAGATPTRVDDIYIPSSVSQFPTLSSNTEVKDVAMDASAKMRIKSNVTLDVAGDFEVGNGNPINLGQGTLKFSGTEKQTLDGKIKANLLLDNSNDLEVNNAAIFGDVQFTNGDIAVGDSDITVQGLVTGTGANSYFKITGDGGLKMNVGSSPDTFKIGFNPYLPVIIDCPDCNGSETFTISVSDGLYDNPVTQSSLLTTNVVTNTWKIETDANKKVNITLQWNASDEASLGNDVHISFWRDGTNSNWLDSASKVMTKSGSDPYSASRDIIAMNGTYYIGVGNSSSALPVELSRFDASWQVANEVALLEWETSSEINNERFEIERRADQGDWQVIAQVGGAGSSDASMYYSYTDSELEGLAKTNEKVYYRLVQYDFDGTNELSEVRSLNVNFGLVNAISVYPNPISGEYVHTTLVSDYELYSPLGSLIGEFKNTNRLRVGELPKGVYVLVHNEQSVAKLVKH